MRIGTKVLPDDNVERSARSSVAVESRWRDLLQQREPRTRVVEQPQLLVADGVPPVEVPTRQRQLHRATNASSRAKMASMRPSSNAPSSAPSEKRPARTSASDLAVLWLFHNPHRGATDRLAKAALAGERVATNSASFKGMERPVVVLGLDIDATKTDRTDEVRRAIYTTATRARSMLVVVGDPGGAEAIGLSALASKLREADSEADDTESNQGRTES